MKKILATLTVATAVALSTYAQGLVVFSSGTQNNSTNNTIAALGATAAGRTAGAGSFYYALFVSSTATTVGGTQTAAVQGTNGAYAFNDASWTFVGLGSSTATAGRWAANSPNGDGSTTIPGIAAGNSAQFVVVGWSVNLGTDVNALKLALAAPGTVGFLGQSVVSGAIATGNGGLLPTPPLFQGSAPQMQAFTLGSFQTPVTVIPEPTTLALAGLGGASLLLFRRRK